MQGPKICQISGADAPTQQNIQLSIAKPSNKHGAAYFLFDRLEQQRLNKNNKCVMMGRD